MICHIRLRRPVGRALCCGYPPPHADSLRVGHMQLPGWSQHAVRHCWQVNTEHSLWMLNACSGRPTSNGWWLPRCCRSLANRRRMCGCALSSPLVPDVSRKLNWASRSTDSGRLLRLKQKLSLNACKLINSPIESGSVLRLPQ